MIFSNLIAGQFVQADDGKTLNHVDPSTGQVRGTLPDSDILDVVMALQGAHKAQATWPKLSFHERSQFLFKIADLIEQKAEEFANAQALDVGHPVTASKLHSIPRAVSELRYVGRCVLDLESPAVLRDKSISFESRLPIGVVGLITPASDPLFNLVSRFAPAIAVGNVVIAKPSRYTPQTAELFARVTVEAGLPPGVFSLVQGRGDQAGTTLVQHPGVFAIAFVGSTVVGRQIHAQANELLKRTHLSLGARNPVLIFAGVDLAKVVPQVVEACVGTHPSLALRGSRLFIQESIYKEALELLKTAIEKVQMGSPLDAATKVGPLPNEKLASAYRQTIEFASKQNGKLLLDGRGKPETLLPAEKDLGFFVKPALISDLTNCSTLQQDEIIGPFLNTASFKYQHEALKHANTSPYGLMSYVFEANGAKAKRVATSIETGFVTVNSGVPLLDAAVEYEPLKNSGLGRIGGLALLNFFSRRVTVAENFSS